LDSKTLEGSA